MKDITLPKEEIEMNLLLEAIYLRYGYDFRQYSPSSLSRRLKRRLLLSGLENLTQVQERVLHDPSFFKTLILDFSINVTEMFRDPSFFLAMRRDLIPTLRDLPFVRIWHAGCASGEEVYSMAIMLMEEGIYDKTLIYATDFNNMVLTKAKEGGFPMSRMEKYEKNYKKAGGKTSLEDYCTINGEEAFLDLSLKGNIVFADHNLATDSVFNEMNLIVCRNVLIYFNGELKNRVLKLFRESLGDEGFLCLGSKESVEFSDYGEDFVEVNEKERIFKKKEVEEDGRYWWSPSRI